MKLIVIFLTTAFLQISMAAYSQRVNLTRNNSSLEQIFKDIRNQTGYDFIYDAEAIRQAGKVSVSLQNASVEKVLTICLEHKDLNFSIKNNTIIVGPRENFPEVHRPADQQQDFRVNGRVVDENSDPIAGASVWVKGTRLGTITNAEGFFSLNVPDSGMVLQVTFIGYLPKDVRVTAGAIPDIKMVVNTNELAEVVVNNGLFERKMSTMTGAVAVFSGADVKKVTNTNVLKGLSILDPSFRIIENTNIGSDPNRLPDIQVRGQTGIPDLNSQYGNLPNQPLFVLDGFETTLQRVYDLNINLIKSVTILKDASAKAIYGAKAGNGVVVIESITPKAGAMRVSYSGSLNVTAPDLSSYRLTNAAEKIQAESLAGLYSSKVPQTQADLLRMFSVNQKAVLDGVDTYWLSQPLQNGFGQRHGIVLDGGDDAFRYSANVSYNNNIGVMKASNRETVSGGVTLSYRLKKFLFRNMIVIDDNNAVNSKYGSFGEYARMNPYWRIRDDQGQLIPFYEGISGVVYNPLYNASLNTKDNSGYTNITENFYTEYNPLKNLRFMARVGLTTQNNQTDYYLPANHTSFLSVPVNSDQYMNRGSYTQVKGKQAILSSDFSVAYNLSLGKHQLFSNAIASVNQNKMSNTGFTVVGFPSDRIEDIAFGNQFLEGSRPTATDNIVRTLAGTFAANYSYDNRFLADLSFRQNGSSQFGANSRWGSFASAGLGWNVHNERWLKEVDFLQQLRLRASIGNTGTPGTSAYQSLATYRYITSQNYNGDIGMTLLGIPNEDLQWQKVLDKNAGFDALLFNKLSLRFDYYVKDTKGLLSDQIVAPSLGFASYKENVGEVRNQGYQVAANLNLLNKDRKSVSVYLNVEHQSNKIRKVSNSLIEINRANDDLTQRDNESAAELEARQQKAVTRYVPGMSMSAIWVVPSLGIDPSNGKEIFLKKDGTQTYEWSVADYVVGGDTNPDFIGVFGSNVRLGNFTGGFAFSFRTGGQVYNNTLVQRVENADFAYNVDLRALEERWNAPGQLSLYKDIADLTATRPTSRFVQDLSELTLSSISLGYDFNKVRFTKSRTSRLNVSVNLNDLATFSSVKVERGLDYPFARTISLAVQASF